MLRKLARFFYFFPIAAFAQQRDIVVVTPSASGGSSSVGTVATNLNVATTAFSSILDDFFYIIGIALICIAVIKYNDYRNNPSQTPLRNPVFFLILGLIIATFPLILKYLAMIVSPYNV